jgi:diadenosine tetraphosphate (Ap4A) HIT family hydrolase
MTSAMRSRKHARQYKKYQQAIKHNVECVFCALDAADPQYVSETVHFKVIRNRFPYVLWDAQRVVDHLMLVPRQHTDTLKTLSPKESKEYVELISDFENKGYNIYARSPRSSLKSVLHQHTHLIKVEPRSRRRVVITTAKPFVRFAR